MPSSKKKPGSAPTGKSAAPPIAAEPRPAPGENVSRPVLAVIVACLWLAAFLRIWAATDEFWMDEIWSLFDFAGDANSPLDIFRAHHDNNHYLVTLWMYLLGPNQGNWALYRIPSILAGIGTVLLAAVIARRWGTAATLAATILTGTSYVLICFSSEARGYALAGFFTLVAMLAVDRFLATRSLWANVLFIAAAILGVLSHLTFVEVYFALVAWSCVGCWKISTTPRDALWLLARLHIVPLSAFTLLYMLDVRWMKIGGGDIRTIEDVVASTLTLVAGSTSTNVVGRLFLGGTVVTAAVASLVLLARAGSILWIFFAAGIFVAPALLLVLNPPELIYERYFYVNLLLFLVLLSYLFGRLWQFRPVGPIVATAALVACVAGNSWQTFELIRDGRGHFRDALEYIIENDPDAHEIHLAGDGKRSRAVAYIEFYSRYVDEPRFVFDDIDVKMPRVPEWFIVISQRVKEPAARLSPFESRGFYELRRVFPHSGITGLPIAVYHWSPNAEEGVTK